MATKPATKPAQEESSDVRTKKDKFAKIPIEMFDGLMGYAKKHASHLEKTSLFADEDKISYQQK